ncbi:hypothetical protein [Actinophytocola sp.]
MTRRLMSSFARPAALDELTARESEVLGCLDLRSRVHAAVLAKDAGLVG